MLSHVAAAQEEDQPDQYTPMPQFSLPAYGVWLDIPER